MQTNGGDPAPKTSVLLLVSSLALVHFTSTYYSLLLQLRRFNGHFTRALATTLTCLSYAIHAALRFSGVFTRVARVWRCPGMGWTFLHDYHGRIRLQCFERLSISWVFSCVSWLSFVSLLQHTYLPCFKSRSVYKVREVISSLVIFKLKFKH